MDKDDKVALLRDVVCLLNQLKDGYPTYEDWDYAQFIYDIETFIDDLKS